MQKIRWKRDEDSGSVGSDGGVEIPWLGQEVQVWFDLEENRNWWTKKQEKIFLEFKRLPDSARSEFIEALEQARSKYLRTAHILAMESKNILDEVDWNFSSLFIPKQADPHFRFVVFAADMDWPLADDGCFLEIGLVYVNGRIQHFQSLSGIGSARDLFEVYLKRT